jgi:hypothetical protein
MSSRELERVAAALTAQGQRAISGDPDLATVVVAWPDLPEAIRAGIMAMMKAARP